MFRKLLSRFSSSFASKPTLKQPVRARPQLEVLEDRALPAALFVNVPVSPAGQTNAIATAATSHNVAVAPNGSIVVAYTGDNGIQVGRSTNRGQSFRPSVQVTDTNTEVDLEIARNGQIYVAWVEDSQVMISRSVDNGKTFSTPALVGMVDSNIIAVHLAAQGQVVYLVPANGPAGTVVFVNRSGGVGAFTVTPVEATPRRFADVQIDPQTGNVFVISDDPILRVFRSTDHGASFTPLALSTPAAEIRFSSTTISSGAAGVFAFVSGTGSAAFRINLANGQTKPLTFGTDTDGPGRSLSADASGNLVDAFFKNDQIRYHVSDDLGRSFAAPVTVATAESANVMIDPLTSDILVAFQRNGRIFLSVYAVEPPGRSVFIPGR